MKVRIAIWTCAGFLVAAGWATYAFLAPGVILPSQAALWALVRVTCPIAFASFYFHFGVSLYWVLLANAVTYGLIGLMIESLRHQLLKPAPHG